MSDTLRDEALFPTLTEEQIGWLRQRGEERQLQPDEQIYSEGDPSDSIYVVLEGAIKVTKFAGGQDAVITIHHPGGFTGDLSVLTGGAHIATARALGPTRALRISADEFREIIGICPQVQSVFLPAMAHRAQDAEMITQQREKLASLGALSAGLAHELNNPASAARSAAQQLRQAFKRQQAAGVRMSAAGLTATQRERLIEIVQRHEAEIPPAIPLDPLAQSEREEALIDWLGGKGVDEGWNLAPVLARSRVDEGDLNRLAAEMPLPTLDAAIHWLCAVLEAGALIDEIDNGTTRIATLVKAIKEYTYMDQAPMQEIDVHEGLENTLTILGYKLRKNCISVERDYGSDLPTVCAYGSELNQVWTNLIDNAVDALSELTRTRIIRIRTRRDGDSVIVELEDNGPGISSEIQARIFEPFFTTKGVGRGTGLGLDIAYRIVVKRHHGDIQVFSRPGETRFIVRLPEKR